MGCKMPFDDKVAHDRLNGRRHARQESFQTGLKMLHQSGRRQNEAQAQRWKKRFRKRADIDDTAGLIHALQGRQRQARKAEFAIPVVFYDPSRAILRRGQQGDTPFQRHIDAKRLLMRRRDESEPKFRGFFERIIDIESARHRPEPAPNRRHKRQSYCARRSLQGPQTKPYRPDRSRCLRSAGRLVARRRR